MSGKQVVPSEIMEQRIEAAAAARRTRDFFIVVIGHRGSFVHATEPIDRAGVEQHRGGELCLPGAAMTDQCDVPDAYCVIDLHGGALR